MAHEHLDLRLGEAAHLLVRRVLLAVHGLELHRAGADVIAVAEEPLDGGELTCVEPRAVAMQAHVHHDVGVAGEAEAVHLPAARGAGDALELRRPQLAVPRRSALELREQARDAIGMGEEDVPGAGRDEHPVAGEAHVGERLLRRRDRHRLHVEMAAGARRGPHELHLVGRAGDGDVARAANRTGDVGAPAKHARCMHQIVRAP
jgi:hypothetical protein